MASTHWLAAKVLRGFGMVEWVEIMESRPQRVDKDIVGLEHAEFYYPHFDEVRAVLGEKGIAHKLRKDKPSHHWVEVVINNSGQELKLNDKPMAEIVK